ncbi:MAG: hypothetical protein IPL53_01485 [Ignavibacteria bacterium]|nr:hypothetical protein [Ignavibacteria bacterium]
MTKTQRYSIEKFFSIRSISGFTLSQNDKKIYYITNTSGTPQIWSIPIEGGWTDQISTWKESVKQIFHNPVTKEIIFMSDKEGDENTQIYKIPDEGGDAELLSKGFEDSQVFFNQFNKKGNKFLFASNKRLKHNFDVYIQDLKKGENELVKSFDDDYPTLAESWSSDERYITFIKFYGNINVDLFLYDSKDKTFINTTEHDINKNVFNGQTEFNKKNSGFYFISDEGREFKGIKFYDIKKRKSKWVIKEKWDITSFKFSHDHNFLIWTMNMNGSNSPGLMNMKTGKVHKLKLPRGNYSGIKFTHDNKKIVYICDSPLNPGDIFVYDLKKETSKQITNSLVGGVSKKGLTKARDVFYKSFDGLKIHALLYIPKGLKKDGKNPAIVWPHGGPEHQEMHNFSK